MDDPKDFARVEKYQENLQDSIEDGGGCTEAWEALSTHRESNDRTDRRSFVRRFGITIGAIPLVGTQAAANDDSVPEDSAPVDVDVERSELRGSERGQVVSRAVRSKQVHELQERLDARPNPTSAFAYHVGDDEGVGVTFETDGVRVLYYESERLPGSGTKVFGARRLGDGFRFVDVDTGELIEFETPRVESMVEQIRTERAYKEIVQRYEIANVLEAEAVLVENLRADRNGVVLPIEEDGELVGRVIAEMVDVSTTRELRPSRYEFEVQHADDGVAPQGHVRCVLGVCTDFCSLLCAALPVGAGAGCLGTCARYIASWPIAVSCGVICWAVGEGVCYPTCMNQTGHDPT